MVCDRSIATRLLTGFGLLLFLAASLAVPAAAQTDDDQQKTINAWNATLERVDLAIDGKEVADEELRKLRQEVSTVVDAASTFADSLTAKVNSAAAQVKELAPITGADEAVSDAIQENLAVAQKLFGDLSGSQKQAQAIVAHGTYTSAQINERRRQVFTAQLLQRNSSLIDPSLWNDAADEVPPLLRRTGDLFNDWASVWQSRGDRSAIAIVSIVILMIIGAIIPGRRILIRRLRKRELSQSITNRSKVIAASVVVAVNTLVPLTALVIGHAILNALNLSPERIDELWYGMTSAVVLFSLGFGVARALLAPSRPELRLVTLEDDVARRVFTLVVAIAAMQALVVFVERFARVAFTGLPLIIAVDGILSIATAVLIILTVRTLNRRNPAEEEPENEIEDESLLQRIALVVAGIAAASAIVASLMGYVSLGRFVTTQTAWIATVISLLVLTTRLADEMTAAWFRREGVVGSRLISSVGFAPRSLTQVGVLFNGLVRVLLIGLAVLLIIAPWGVDSSSILESAKQLFFSFKIGSITISFSTIIAGVIVFAVGILITRGLQGWLDTRFLPTTRLDSGLRNSIRTSVGHVGMIIAATVAFGYAGLDLSNIAIVAGALSVGIGLGLQAIVNNFVSGLILLAERPIRAGDWIAVGAEEGIVKRINVRATEIETFDRATVIVPNSSLITGVVKNMVLRDRSGRIIVPIIAAKASDPEQIRTILLDVAKAHSQILAYPTPVVLFTNFTDTTFEFELRCYLSDIAQGAVVRSDIRFQCIAKFAENGIALP